MVDAIGSLDDAIVKAAKLAKLEEYHATSYPAPAGWFESLLDKATNKGNYLDEQVREAMGDYYDAFVYLKNINHQSAIQARLPYFIEIK